jgi:sulfur relay (sulfurtransferase) DsrF/TusC family protein
MHKVMILIRSPPYGTTNAGEGLRAGIAIAGMDIETTIVLMGDAIYAALTGQDPEAINAISLSESIANAKDFGARLVVHDESMRQRGIGRGELLGVEIMRAEEVAQLAREVDATITF